jgi:hypothetical protein
VSEESSVETTGLVRQPHGGALRRGGKPGNKGGRPTGYIRRRLRGGFAQRIHILEGIADGVVDVNLRETCEHCGKEPTQSSARDWLDTVIKRVRAAVGEQLKAFDLMGKYGVGTLKAITDEDIRERLSQQLEIIRNSPNASDPEALIKEIEPAWR